MPHYINCWIADGFHEISGFIINNHDDIDNCNNNNDRDNDDDHKYNIFFLINKKIYINMCEIKIE